MTNLLKKSLVRILKTNNEVVGAGFLVGKKQVLTCAHVIRDSLSLLSTPSDMPQGEILLDFPFLAPSIITYAKVAHWTPRQSDGTGDIAELELTSSPPSNSCPAHLISNSVDKIQNHHFSAFGFPIGQDQGVWTYGVVRDERVDGSIQLEDIKIAGKPIEGGFSGTPVWDDELRYVIGMITTADRKVHTNKVAFMIPVHTILDLRPDLKQKSEKIGRFAQGILGYPDGAIKLNSPRYIERKADSELRQELSYNGGSTITIRSPKLTGKSSLLIRSSDYTYRQGCKNILIDMKIVDKANLRDLDTFLRYFALLIIRNLHLKPEQIDRIWSSGLGPSNKITELMENYILTQGYEKLMLIVDDADRLSDTTFPNDFYRILRVWHNLRASEDVWNKLDIVLAISTAPARLIEDDHQSPFVVGQQIDLEDFDLEQVRELGRYYKLFDDNQVLSLMNYLSGHPYLTNITMYTMVKDRVTWLELKQVVSTESGPFARHLRNYWRSLRTQPKLCKALVEIISNGSCDDEYAYDQLWKFGLVKGSDKRSCSLRCLVYEEYLKSKLL